MYPDFLGIGAQKAGTTWLHRNIEPHPEIWMPKIKELHYFDKKIGDTTGVVSRLLGKSRSDHLWRRQAKHWLTVYLRKEPSLEGLRWTFRYFMRKPSDEWYASLFEPRNGLIAGEITPAYSILEKEMVAHIYRLMPEAKIIFLMRNPIERAWSHAVMDLDKKDKGAAEFASKEELLRRFGRKDSRLLTDYLRTLENWGSFYPEEQIFVGFLEDIRFYPDALLDGIYSFLGVDPSFRPRSAKCKIHSRAVETMPTRIASHLAGVYREEIERLEGRFGGYASFWLYCAERLTEAPPEEALPYPLWESSLWQEWVEAYGQVPPIGSREARLQSGLLSAFS